MKQKKDESSPKQPAPETPAEPQKEKGQEPTAAEYLDQLMRLKAEFENYRKRVEKEKPALIEWGRAEMILKLLPLYDAILNARQQTDRLMSGDKAACSGPTGELCRGLDMIFKEFAKVFECVDIRAMETVGKPYDPMAHEVVTVVPGDEANDGLVINEVQKGFMCGSKVLRPAKVSIAKKMEPAGVENPAPPEGGQAQEQ